MGRKRKWEQVSVDEAEAYRKLEVEAINLLGAIERQNAEAPAEVQAAIDSVKAQLAILEPFKV